VSKKVNLGPGVKDIKEVGLRQKSGKICVCLGQNITEYNQRNIIKGI
jgi:hypothetical protein